VSGHTPCNGNFAFGAGIFFLYMPSLDFDFLDWDDTTYIQRDAVTAQGLSEKSLSHAFTTFNNPYFMPLTRLSYMTDVSLYGIESARGFRLTNILLHIINCLLLLLLVYKATSRLLVAFMVALVFAIHPQHVESVVWIAGRKELLAGIFGVASLLAYQQYATTQNKAWYLLTLLSYAASLFCKPIWIALPLLLLLWDFFPLQKLGTGNVRHCLVEKLPFLFFGLAYSLLFTYSLHIDGIPISYYPDPSWDMRWVLPLLAIGKYLANTFIPFNLVPYYAFPDQVTLWPGLLWAGVLLALLSIFWRLRFQVPGLLMAALWFGIALLPALKITVLPQGEAIFTADRYTYAPHIGLFIGIIFSIQVWVNTQKRTIKLGALVITVLVLAGLCVNTAHTITKWQTPEKLWLSTIAENTGKGRAYPYGMLGLHYQKSKRFDEAYAAFRQAHDIYPHHYIYPLMLGILLENASGGKKEARRWLDMMLDEAPAPALILREHANINYANGDTITAERFFSKAVERNQQEGEPLNTKEMYVLQSFAQVKNHRIDQAVDSLGKANLSMNEKSEACQYLSRIITVMKKTKSNLQENKLNEFCQWPEKKGQDRQVN
jgi:protein O-mannosyl-transferase